MITALIVVNAGLLAAVVFTRAWHYTHQRSQQRKIGKSHIGPPTSVVEAFADLERGIEQQALHDHVPRAAIRAEVIDQLTDLVHEKPTIGQTVNVRLPPAHVVRPEETESYTAYKARRALEIQAAQNQAAATWNQQNLANRPQLPINRVGAALHDIGQATYGRVFVVELSSGGQWHQVASFPDEPAARRYADQMRTRQRVDLRVRPE